MAFDWDSVGAAGSVREWIAGAREAGAALEAELAETAGKLEEALAMRDEAESRLRATSEIRVRLNLGGQIGRVVGFVSKPPGETDTVLAIVAEETGVPSSRAPSLRVEYADGLELAP